jgi:hypothetical protein
MLAELPDYEEYRKIAASKQDNRFSDLEAAWISVSPENFPLLYERDTTPSNCKSMPTRATNGAVLQSPTTCPVSWSWIGFLTLLAAPVTLLAFILASLGWIFNGFRQSKSQN